MGHREWVHQEGMVVGQNSIPFHTFYFFPHTCPFPLSQFHHYTPPSGGGIHLVEPCLLQQKQNEETEKKTKGEDRQAVSAVFASKNYYSFPFEDDWIKKGGAKK